MKQDEINAVKKAAEKMRKQESDQDEIIRFAIQCRLVTTGNRDGIYMDALTEFAKLVAAKATDVEREACAKVEKERRGFAGVKIWVGNKQVVRLLTQTELDRAYDTWGLVEQASEMCVAALKEMNT